MIIVSNAFSADSHLHESVLLSVPIPADFRLYLTNVSSSGWEKNKDKLIPKLADLSKLMDPKKLSRNAVELNLKLMKWRIAPELDLESIAQQKCLLLGKKIILRDLKILNRILLHEMELVSKVSVFRNS